MRQVKRSEIRLSGWNMTIIAAPEWAFEPWGDRYRSNPEAFVDVLAEIDGVRAEHNRRRAKEAEDWEAYDPGCEWARVLRSPRKFKRAMGLLSYPTLNNYKSCAACGILFFGMGNVRACTDRCAKSLRDASRTRPERKPVEHQPRSCGACGEFFAPARADALYCSGRCRVAAHRRKAATVHSAGR